MAVDGQWGDSMPYTTSFLAAAVCIGRTGPRPALLSIAAGLLLANWLFVPSRRSLNFLESPRVMMGGAYLVTLGIVLGFATWAKRALRRERVHSGALRQRSVALEGSEKRFQALAQAAFEGVLLSQNGRILDCNEQVGALVGYKREELLGKQATDVIAPEQRAGVLRNVQEEQPATYELDLICRDGTRRTVEAHGRPMRNSDSESLRVSVIRDVTERKSAEEDLRTARDELALVNEELERRGVERTRSLEEKTAKLNAFCYTLAHDFRAPLRTQEGFAQILVEDYVEKLGDAGTSLARRVLRAAQRQSDIIQDLLAHISVTRSELPL